MSENPLIGPVAGSSPGNRTLPEVTIRVGELDVSDWLLNFGLSRTTGLANNQATILLRSDVVDAGHLDYIGPVSISAKWAGVEYPQFYGLIEFAESTRDGLELRCRSNASLNDLSVGAFLHENLRGFEIIYTLSRTAGFAEELLQIDGMDTLQDEAIEAVVPILGIAVDSRITIGSFTIVPRSEIGWVQQQWSTEKPARLGDPAQLVSDFMQPEAFLVGTYVESRLLAAETRALRDAEVVSAWLAARLSFSGALLPNGNTQPYNRVSNSIRPQRASMAAVRGLTTGRRWLRFVQVISKSMRTAIPICSDWRDEPILAADISLQDREALLTFWRARDVSDPLSSLIALWDTIEFYVGGNAAPKLFTSDEIAKLRTSPPDWLSEAQRDRYVEYIGGLNSASVNRRLALTLERDDVPVTSEELALLQKLRKLRNPAQHGRERIAPDAGDLKRAWAIVAKMLVYRLRSADGGPNT